MRRLTLYTFVISLLWLGFVCAISFIALPLVSRAPGMELRQVAGVSSALAHGLQRIEWICCAFSWLLVLRVRLVRERISMIALAGATAALLFQTFALMPDLDQQTVWAVGGATPLRTWHHQAYVIAEVAKALALGLLSAAQIQAFARAVISE